jgi:hypothetical protein
VAEKTILVVGTSECQRPVESGISGQPGIVEVQAADKRQRSLEVAGGHCLHTADETGERPATTRVTRFRVGRLRNKPVM